MTINDVEKIFDADGLLFQHFPLYEYREGQLLMAELIRRSYEEDAIAVIEAGTDRQVLRIPRCRPLPCAAEPG